MRGPLYAYLIEEWAAIIQSGPLAHQVGKYSSRMGEKVAVLDRRRGLISLTLAVVPLEAWTTFAYSMITVAIVLMACAFGM